MPTYQYHCPKNGLTVEVFHGMSEKLATWGEVVEKAGIDLGDTPPGAPVEIHIQPVNVNTPIGDSKLKEKGFTKLVRKDSGVYENVTRTGKEKRYMDANDPTSMPDLDRKISD